MEVYSRITGYYRAVTFWNKGKKEEFKHRLTYDIAHSTVPEQGDKCHCSEDCRCENPMNSCDTALFFFSDTCAKCQTLKPFLKEQGFVRYEVSNYARPGFECRHNVGYWTGTEYLGLGLGSSSYMAGYRFCNERGLERYLNLDFEGADWQECLHPQVFLFRFYKGDCKALFFY